MATNNLILAVPSADSSVSYEIPGGESATLNFGAEAIDGLKLDGKGGLIISFSEGGNMTLTNFQSFIDNGNTLSLSDGTNVDPKLLFNALKGQNDNPFPTSDITKIGIPASGEQKEVALEAGKKYLFNFDLSETKGADVKDGKMVVGFENGSKIVITNYEEVMAGQNPPELSLASKTCVVTGDELITNIQELAKTNPLDATTITLEEKQEEETKPKSKIADADMKGKEDTGPSDETNLAYKAAKIKPAAGDEEAVAKELAAIETAAGGPAGGRANSGYGYSSRFAPDPFITNSDIGPINPTQLAYDAPRLDPSQFIDQDEPAPDDNPNAIGPGAKFLDETNLSGGSISTSGSIVVDFGADGPGGISPNGSFSAGGSVDNNILSSNGEKITVSIVGNNYVGKTVGGDKVFELAVNSQTGDFTFTQYLPLDHADTANPDDRIVLNFGIVVLDGDGDATTTGVQIIIADDGPNAAGGSGSVDETDLGATISTSGKITVDFGEDGPGNVRPDGNFAAGGSLKNNMLTSGGVIVVVTPTANGYEGKAGGVTVFTLVIDPATGDFTYVQYKALDHANVNDPNDYLTLKFGVDVVDYDGDVAPAPIVITIFDDAPGIQTCGCGPKPDQGLETVDETSLAAGLVIETGKLDADFGADVPGTFALKPNSFSSSGSKLGGNLTHNGIPVAVTLENGVYVGKAGTITIFTLEVTASTGDYRFTLFENLDHADGSNPNDVIVLDFGVIISDYEGDSAEGSIRINVKDDAPIANDDIRTLGEGGGSVTGNVTDNDLAGQDNPATVNSIMFGGVSYAFPADGSNITVTGVHGTLVINKDGVYTYTSSNNAEGADEFTYTYTDFDGDSDTAILKIDVTDTDTIPSIIKPGDEIVDETNLAGGAIITETGTVTADFKDDGPGSFAGNGSFTSSGSKLGGVLTSNGVAVVVNYLNGIYTGVAGGTSVFTLQILADGSYTFRLLEQLDHADGSNANDVIALDFGVVARDADGDEASTTLTVRVQDDAPDARDDGSNVSEGGTVSGNVTGNDVVGQDVPGKVVKVSFGGTVYDVPAAGQLTIAGTYGTLKIDQSGAWTYTAKANADGTDQFFYTLRDYDGDMDTACLSVQVTDTDTIPSIIKPGDEIVDETNLAGGAIITETGTITADFKDDGPGSFAGNGSFTSSGSKLGGVLTSNGVAVVVNYLNGIYTGVAGGTSVFTLQILADGSYTFRLLEQLDHADGSNANDVIALDFGVVARDADGDEASTTLTVRVQDDAPVVTADFCTIIGAQGQVGSNALTNDTIGQDTPGRVTAISYGGRTVAVPASGTTEIAGLHGILYVAANGNYTYVHTDGVFGVSEEFTVTVTDFDGDIASSQLQINLVGNDLQGTAGRDTMSGSNGNETMFGNGGDDWLYGNGGDDYIDGGIGNDIIEGGYGDDQLIGREGHDLISGGDGNDTMFGDGATTDAYAGNDVMHGDAGDDFMYGRHGDDMLDGGTGNDVLYGEEGNDVLAGGAGNDHIIGGIGYDTLSGGSSADIFWFLSANEGVDTIKDFSIAEGDKLELSNVLTNFDPLTDAINDFVFATHSGNNTTILVNNNGTGIGGATGLFVLENVTVSVSDLFNSGSLLA